MGVRRSRCSCAIAFAFSNGIGSSNQPGRNGRSASSSITAVRGDRNSLHSMKISPSGPRPSRAACDQRRGAADLAGLVVAQAFVRERPALERREAAPDRLARAVERVLGRLRALQPVARVAAQRRAHARRRAGARPARRAACPRGPTARCRAPTARSGTPRRRASARRGRGGASAAPVPRDPGRRDAARIRGSRSRPTRSRRAATPRPSRRAPRRWRCARTASCTSRPST